MDDVAARESGARLVRHGVHDAQQRVGERHAGQALCVVHAVARVHIAVIRFLQIVVDHLNGMQCQRVGIIAVQGGHIRLNGMRHGIHTGVSRQLRGHFLGQLRVHNGNVRRDVEVGQRILDALVIIGDHRESRHLGGSAGGRGNGAEARFLAQRGEAERHAQLLKCHFGVLIERPHGFCSVNGAAAAHGHNPIRLEFAHGLGALHHGGNGRIRLNVLEQFHFHASLFQVAHSLIQEAKALHAAAAHDDHRLAALQVFQLFHRTLAMIQVTR